MNYSYLVLFMLLMITVTFFAPLFIVRGYRKAAASKEEVRQKVLKQMGNKAFALYAFGVVMYVVGFVVCLPLMTLLLPVDFPSIGRFADCGPRGVQTCAVIFNRFTLDNTGFVIYYFVFQPLCILISAIGLWRFEKSHRDMKAIEQLAKEKP